MEGRVTEGEEKGGSEEEVVKEKRGIRTWEAEKKDRIDVFEMTSTMQGVPEGPKLEVDGEGNARIGTRAVEGAIRDTSNYVWSASDLNGAFVHSSAKAGSGRALTNVVVKREVGIAISRKGDSDVYVVRSKYGYALMKWGEIGIHNENYFLGEECDKIGCERYDIRYIKLTFVPCLDAKTGQLFACVPILKPETHVARVVVENGFYKKAVVNLDGRGGVQRIPFTRDDVDEVDRLVSSGEKEFFVDIIRSEKSATGMFAKNIRLLDFSV